MKSHLKYLIISLSLLTLFSSCEKENTSKQLNPFYKLKVNGNLKTVPACGTSDHVAQFLKDTAVFAAFGCGGQRAGFYLKGKILDGTYMLDNKNSAWYDEGTATYQTDSLNKGTLTIKSSIFQLANGGRIPIVKGTFSFDAIDKNSGQKLQVTSGQYLLKKYQY
jgi:hypothetical protein